MMLDAIYNMDCLEGLKMIPDKSVDLVITDPPYQFETTGGGFVRQKKHLKELEGINCGISNNMLDMICGKMKHINIYIWCNKAQLRQYIDYFDDLGCFIELLTWHKTNPIPACGNTYLPDTEYLIFAREKGVKLYGTYETKRKWYCTPLNVEDKHRYGHPTIKPLEIIKNLVINSSRGGETVLDPFIGSGTTAVASKMLGRHYIGFEINPEYYKMAVRRVNDTVV